jgi:hypothetical protein
MNFFPPGFFFSPLSASEYTNIFDSFLNIIYFNTAVFQEKSLIYEEDEEDKEEEDDEDDVEVLDISWKVRFHKKKKKKKKIKKKKKKKFFFLINCFKIRLC